MMWSDLPSDLVLLVSEGLTIADFTSFSSVCRSWRSITSTVKHHRPCRHQDPWLMFVGGEDPFAANLYSFSDQKIFTIPKQPNRPIANRICLGSAHGWLITADERSELSLLNPITRQQIDLPPVSTFEHIIPLHRDPDGRITDYGIIKKREGIVDCSAESLRYRLYTKAALSSSPSVDDDYTVVLILCQLNYLSFARSRDEKWTTIGTFQLRNDITYDVKDDKVYTIIWNGKVESWDFSRKVGSLPEPAVLIPDPELEDRSFFYFYYLVRTPWGELLHVRRLREGESLRDFITRSIEVYKIDFETRKMTRIKSLGDYALFLGGNHPICISSKDVPGLKGNCVYFNDEFFENTEGCRNCQRDIGIFNLEDGSIEPILPDNCQLYWPPPIWLMPSLA